MRFGFLSEGDTAPGTSYAHRYWELVEEVLLAEAAGFDWFGTSEQHVTVGGATVSSPEILYSYLAARTSRIRLRHASTLTAMRINHPIRVAERVATEDILSHGRIDLGLARGNSTAQLRAFEVELDETRPQLEEAVAVIRKAFLDVPFSHDGAFYKIPPRVLIPRPVQTPHPPMFLATTSAESHEFAGTEGLGAMSNSNFAGLEAQADLLATYTKAFRAAEADHLSSNYSAGSLVFVTHCAETRAQAYEEVLPIFKDYLPTVVSSLANLAKYSESYAYMEEVAATVMSIIEQADGSERSIRRLVESTGTMVIGDPDDCIEQIEGFAAAGVDEMILRIDTLPHAHLCRSLQLFGKYVIPHFKTPLSVARSMEDNIALLRDRRAADAEARAGAAT